MSLPTDQIGSDASDAETAVASLLHWATTPPAPIYISWHFYIAFQISRGEIPLPIANGSNRNNATVKNPRNYKIVQGNLPSDWLKSLKLLKFVEGNFPLQLPIAQMKIMLKIDKNPRNCKIVEGNLPSDWLKSLKLLKFVEGNFPFQLPMAQMKIMQQLKIDKNPRNCKNC